MAKSNFSNVIIVGILALIAGFFIGYSLKNFPPMDEDLAGSIGKVERYKNVQVTEQDIQLRNELLADTAKRSVYENYLMVYYYQTVKTSADVQTVLEKSASVSGFESENTAIVADLDKYGEYLNTARVDILNGINAVFAVDQEAKAPIISQLNDAQNAIARTKNQHGLIIRYMDALAEFIERNDDRDMSALDDAYDILTINLLQSALISNDKPMLSFLDKKNLKNEEEGAKNIIMQNEGVIKAIVVTDFAAVNSASGIQNAIVSNQAVQGQVVSNVHNLGIIFQSTVMEGFSFVGSSAFFNAANFSSGTQLQNAAFASYVMGTHIL
jgi:hypothetical protein